jgi:hypothetical protein
LKSKTCRQGQGIGEENLEQSIQFHENEKRACVCKSPHLTAAISTTTRQQYKGRIDSINLKAAAELENPKGC